MRKRLKLTGTSEVLTEKAQEKFDKIEGGSMFEDLTCEHGRTRENYESLGIKIPESLLEKERDFDKGVKLEDDDFEVEEYPVRIYEDEIVGYVRSDEDTIVFTKTGITFTVKETVEEIDELIDNN